MPLCGYSKQKQRLMCLHHHQQQKQQKLVVAAAVASAVSSLVDQLVLVVNQISLTAVLGARCSGVLGTGPPGLRGM
jgi:hypothetical protein